MFSFKFPNAFISINESHDSSQLPRDSPGSSGKETQENAGKNVTNMIFRDLDERKKKQNSDVRMVEGIFGTNAIR